MITSELIVALLIMVVGLIGCVLPVVPGLPIVWLGALYYAWQTGFSQVGILTLALLFVLMLVGATANIWMGSLGARSGGASPWSSLLGLLLGMVGLLVFNLPGMIIGSLLGVAVPELLRHRDWRQTLRASGGYLLAWALASVVEVGIGLLIVLFFLISVAL
jgi:uncharacterized protein YqgC (DUF456 family)